MSWLRFNQVSMSSESRDPPIKSLGGNSNNINKNPAMCENVQWQQVFCLSDWPIAEIYVYVTTKRHNSENKIAGQK